MDIYHRHRGFLCGSAVNNPSASAGDARDTDSIPGWEEFLKKEMTTHSSTLAWEIPWTEEPCGLQSMGSQSLTRFSN